MNEHRTNSAFVRVFTREVSRIMGSWVLVFTTLVAPLLAFIVITWLFSQGVVRDLPIAVVDQDNSSFSQRVTQLVDASPVCNVVWKVKSEQEAMKLMMEGRVDAVVVLPDQLEKNVLRGNAPAVAVYINNTNVVKGGVLKSGLVTTLSTVSAGVKVQVGIKKGMTPEQAVQRARPVKVNSHLLFNPFGNYSYFLVLGLLPLLSIVFIFLGSVYALGMEFKEGTAGELLSVAGDNVVTALLGKMLPYTLLFFFDLMVVNVILIHYLGTPIHGSLSIILLSELLLVIAYQAAAILILKLSANLRLSLSLGSAYTMMALTFSGLTFPSIAMPAVAKIFGLIFPYTYWLRIFMSQTLRGEPLHEVILPMLAFIPFIIAGILAFPGMKRKMSHAKYWYRE